MRKLPSPRSYTPVDKLYLLWFLCMIDQYPADQNKYLSPKAMADQFGPKMLDTTLYYIEMLKEFKLVYAQNYQLKLTPRGQELVANWQHHRDTILAL
jgi:hypothetical protein